jgi:hypothetical protein
VDRREGRTAHDVRYRAFIILSKIAWSSNGPQGNIRRLNPNLRIEPLTCNFSVGLTGFEPATP